MRFALASPSPRLALGGRPGRAAGARDDGRYFIASTTKLYVTALVMQLRAEGLLDLRGTRRCVSGPLGHGRASTCSTASTPVSASRWRAARAYLGHRRLLRAAPPRRLHADRRALAQDFGWTLDDVLRITKEELRPQFAPSTPGKAYYSDTNFQLLGAVIEAVTGPSYEEALRERILDPLGLART